ncbi:hypothetical protein M2102_000207 [Fusobacterium sp. PH5-7]|nr:hypothetical protein [Fusobacterium sp. PH5-7]
MYIYIHTLSINGGIAIAFFILLGGGIRTNSSLSPLGAF